MTLKDIEDLLHDHVTLDDGPLVAFEQVVALWREHRIDGATEDPSDDMLLFQYGTYDWRDGTGPHFELDLTRQAIPQPEGDDFDVDVQILQLACTFRYPPELFVHVAPHSVWFRDPATADEVLAALRADPALQLACRARAESVRVGVEDAE